MKVLSTEEVRGIGLKIHDVIVSHFPDTKVKSELEQQLLTSIVAVSIYLNSMQEEAKERGLDIHVSFRNPESEITLQ